MSSSGARDVGGVDEPSNREANPGKTYVAVVGIDRYRAWPRLQRAVSDARGARDTFLKLGFKELCPPLFDDCATGDALRRLVTDDLHGVGSDDSLVVFFAGHGHTVTTTYSDGAEAKRGYLVPADAKPPGSNVGDLVSLDNWLHDLAHLPPKHILVVLDACHSGIALNQVIRWRGEDVRSTEPLASLRARRSRRIITSALDNELAMDSGPLEGHSLFTGCLIEALTGGLRARTGYPVTTGSDLALHVQRRVSSFPASRQTPDFGALELDDRGELLIDLTELPATSQPHGVDGILPRKNRLSSSSDASGFERPPGDAIRLRPPAASGVDSIQPKRVKTQPPVAAGGPDNVGSRSLANAVERPTAEASRLTVSADVSAGAITRVAPAQSSTGPASNAAPGPAGDVRTIGTEPVPSENKPPNDPPPPALSSAEAAFMTALDRHQTARQRGMRVLSFVTADPMTGMTGWASWAASRGNLTLATDATGLGAATASLLRQMPWLRLLQGARQRLAAAAKLQPSALDGAFDARSSSDRDAWLDQVAGHDACARVSGWLLAMVREPWGRVPDLASAPVQSVELLAMLCDIAAPIAILLHHPEPTAAWLERAIETAGELVESLPRCAVGVNTPGDLAASTFRGRFDSRAWALARKSEVPLTSRTPRAADPARSRAVQTLHAALSQDPRTAGLFERTTRVSTPDQDRAVEVDLISHSALLAIEIDDWYLFRDPQAYARDRVKDLWLMRAQFFVMRFLVEDVGERIGQIVDEVAIALSGRRASGAFSEDPK